MNASYRVRVWDNFHYMDDDEAYDLGTYATYEEALAAAKKLVEEEVAHYGCDMGQYCGFGGDPVVIGPPGEQLPRFSARDYARELCERKERRSSSTKD